MTLLPKRAAAVQEEGTPGADGQPKAPEDLEARNVRFTWEAFLWLAERISGLQIPARQRSTPQGHRYSEASGSAGTMKAISK